MLAAKGEQRSRRDMALLVVVVVVLEIGRAVDITRARDAAPSVLQNLVSQSV
jgi:hypothetical protein